MRTRRIDRTARMLVGGLGAAAVGYAAWVAGTWYRYGHDGGTADGDGAGGRDLLDRFMPSWEVAERHAVEIDAPADATWDAARRLDLNRSPLIRAIFALRSVPARLRGFVPEPEARSLLEETQALGWRVLAETPGRAVVLGAVARAWEADVEFRGLAPDEFIAFDEPGYVKIAWTLEAEPLGPGRSRFVTRTRVTTTDAAARERFRRYWAVVSPGVRLIRRASLPLVKRDAEALQHAGR